MNGRGSVSRSFNYARKYLNPEFRRKCQEYSRIKAKRRKEEANKRCVDCGVLISPDSIRCKNCSIRHNYEKYYKNKENRKF